MYDHLLGRRPNNAEVREGATFIQQNGFEKMVDGAVDSREYAENFGDWRVPDSNVAFCPPRSGLTARPRGTSGTLPTTFDRADRNRDGRITVSEWDDTRQAFQTADANRDNILSREEYNAALGVSGAVGTSGSRNDQFDQLDANRNNRLERNEWRESGETFNWLDRNGDGWLSRGEVVGRRSQ
jgi:Ca2+-binding EF-hand superfamily protein